MTVEGTAAVRLCSTKGSCTQAMMHDAVDDDDEMMMMMMMILMMLMMTMMIGCTAAITYGESLLSCKLTRA